MKFYNVTLKREAQARFVTAISANVKNPIENRYDVWANLAEEKIADACYNMQGLADAQIEIPGFESATGNPVLLMLDHDDFDIEETEDEDF